MDRQGILTPRDPSGWISRARLTRPYAPRPISPSMKNSDMSRPPKKDSCSEHGEGARVLSILPELGVRFKFSESIGGGEGRSMGAIDTRPAIRETRCWEDLLRGRDDGDGGSGGIWGVCGAVCGQHAAGEMSMEGGRGGIKRDFVVIVLSKKRPCATARSSGSVFVSLFSGASSTLDSEVNEASWLQSKPRPMDVTPQLPTPAALQASGGSFHSSSSNVRLTGLADSINCIKRFSKT